MSDNLRYGDFTMPTVDELFFDADNSNILEMIFQDEFELHEIDINNTSGSRSTGTGQVETIQVDIARSSEPKSEEPMDETMNCARFSVTTEQEIKKYEDAHQSISTKMNTKWVAKLFQDWHINDFGSALDMTVVSPAELSGKLRRFYCEAKTKSGEQYHKNTLKNIRAALNRYLSDLGREIDIVRGNEFKSANKVLDGMLKDMLKTGTSRPTSHKPVIVHQDLYRIRQYFESAESNPVILRQAVWYFLSIHFISRGLEFHHQLLKTSVIFKKDDANGEYVTLSHEYQQKNFQGGLYSKEAPTDKRMYATGLSTCPVRLLHILLDKTDDAADHVFNTCNKDAMSNPIQLSHWYSDKPLSKRSFCNFMPDISKSSKCTQRYTAHCLRATAITAMSDAGYESRHIMFMSGHQCESSLRSYSRNLSVNQKKQVSATLSSVANGLESQHQLALPPPSSNSMSALNQTEGQHAAPFTANHPTNTMTMSSISSAHGYLSNGVFNNCVFNFELSK